MVSFSSFGLLGDGSFNFYTIMALVFAYFIGNISPAILIGRAYGIDIKSEGSGNAGTTNVLRTLGKKSAIWTLLIDILKGVIAVTLGGILLGDKVAGYCVAAVIVGHIWPAFFGFKGGKGVATAFGALLAYNWAMALTALGIVALGVLISRRMSFGSVIGAGTFPIVAYFYNPTFLPIGIILAILILFKHKSNINRLIKGQEPKLGQKKKEQ